MLLVCAGENLDRTTISFGVHGDTKTIAFNVMFALGEQLILTARNTIGATWCALLQWAMMAPQLTCVATGIIAFAFGNPILPEVQATVGGNAKTVMYKVSPSPVSSMPSSCDPSASPEMTTWEVGALSKLLSCMSQGISAAYAVITSSYLIVAIAGALPPCSPLAQHWSAESQPSSVWSLLSLRQACDWCIAGRRVLGVWLQCVQLCGV